MAKKKRRKKKPARQAQAEPYPGWMWMLFGLAIGLSVAAAIYLRDRGANAVTEATLPAPASMEAPIDAEPVVPEPAPVAEAPEAPEEEPRFSFYSMLPNFEVVIPEEETDVSRDDAVAAVEETGTYVLQAGSFNDATDADRRRAELALLGIESQIQRIAIDDRVYHRVRVGPISDLDELNRVRGRLHEAQIDVLRIRLGD